MSYLANRVGRNGPGSQLRRPVAPVGRLTIAVTGIAAAGVIGLCAVADDGSSTLRWPQSAAGLRSPAASVSANTAHDAQQPDDRHAGANQPMRLPVLIPASGRRKSAVASPDPGRLDPPVRLEFAADSPALGPPAPASELRMWAVSEEPVQPVEPKVAGAHPAAADRIAWPDSWAHPGLRPDVPGAEPAAVELSFQEGSSGVSRADSTQHAQEHSASPPRLRTVAADEPAHGAELRLASFVGSSEGSATGTSSDGSAGADARPEWMIRQAAHLRAAEDSSSAAVSSGASDARLGPFQIVDSAHELTVWLRGTRRLLPASEVVEAVPGDPNICQVFWDRTQEIVVVGRNVGSTSVTFHFRDQACPPYTCQVRVAVAPEDGPPTPRGTPGAPATGVVHRN